MLKEVSRVLSPTGVYIVITHGEPKNRFPVLERVLLSCL
jgi:ubiquinone/menaquinone biosynthesis C-methylase UbiE